MTLRNIVSAVLGIVAIGATSFGAAQLLQTPEPLTPASARVATTGGVAGTTVGDISGPCDEAENRNDPRCAGVNPAAATGTTTTAATTTGREPGEDISGPCDEAEHRNDPRCTGAPAADDDHSGPGGGGGDRNHDGGNGDRSGPNSGRG